ncbi:cobalamin-binding protein [uncultured Ferrimonas sp.]|uniref:cobalamin-binding protein n=1 Tax=uncultured Ferrimonas sp. TaxID=432640 RepID=UPI00261E0706|nr:cobalamin-binding protein [uncultured Ferrimonas sp.]
MTKQLVLLWALLSAVTVAVAAPASAATTKTTATTTTTSTPMRIAAMSPSSVELLFAVGAGEQIVATVEYADYPPAATQIPRVGRYNHIDMEALLLSQPDLVVVAKADTNAELLQRLALVGVPVIDSSVSQLEQIPVVLRQLAAISGHKAQGEQVAEQFQLRLQQLLQRYQQRQPVTVFYQVWPEPLTTVAGGWIEQMLSSCGGSNVFASALADYPQVSVEQVLVAAPQLILKPTHQGFSNSESQPWQQWPEIPAIKQQLQLTIDGDLVHRNGPRALDGLAQICQRIDQARQVYYRE